MAVVAAPAVEAEHALSHRGYVLLVFALPLLLGAGLEAACSVLSDRVPRERVVAGGLFLLSAALVGCALAGSGAVLTACLTLAGAASGVSCAAAQSTLIAVRPGDAERTMTRWVLFAAIGDVLTPLLLVGVFAFEGSYRVAFAAIAVMALAQGFVVISRPLATSVPALVPPVAEPASDASEPFWQALSAGAANRGLWLWLFGAAMCTLLDEIVVALAMLRMEGDLGFSRVSAAGCAITISLGAAVGAWLTDRLLSRLGSTRLLILSAVASALALAALLCATTRATLLPALFMLGVAEAPQYALLAARAYESLPERPGVVNALGQVFVALDIVAPLVLGVIADELGLGVALACLVAQPFTVLALVLLFRHGRARWGDFKNPGRE